MLTIADAIPINDDPFRQLPIVMTVVAERLLKGDFEPTHDAFIGAEQRTTAREEDITTLFLLDLRGSE